MSLRKTVPKGDLLHVDGGRGAKVLSLPGAGGLESGAHLTQNGHPSFQGRTPHYQSQAGFAVNSTLTSRQAGLTVAKGPNKHPHNSLLNAHCSDLRARAAAFTIWKSGPDLPVLP